MNQDFKLRYDQLKENDPTGENSDALQNQNFETPGHVRNLCFVWPDGRMKFMNYAYLISVELFPDESSIVMIYTSNKVTIKGIKLHELFVQLFSHLPKGIEIVATRYTKLHSGTIVSDIVMDDL